MYTKVDATGYPNVPTKDLFEKIQQVRTVKEISIGLLLLFSLCRLASDLLLWEPMAPSPVDRPDQCGFNIGTGLDLASQMLQAQGPDRFVMCRSGLRSYDDGNF